MENAKARIAEILEKSPLPSQMKKYFKERLEREGVTVTLIESLKSMLRASEADAFGRMGISIDEDGSPEIKKAIKLHSDAVAAAADKYLAVAEGAAGKISKANTKAAKKMDKVEKDLIKVGIM